MKISEVCIQRPVFAWVMTLIVIILGLVGVSRLPLQQYPRFDKPYLTIEASLPGASPEIVEAQVTKIIEEAVAGIEGVESITSQSKVEDSSVSLEIRPDRRVDDIANDVRDKLNKASEKFDDAVTQPILTRSRVEDRPILSLALTSETMSVSDLADYAIRELQKDIESLTGVSKVDVLGAGEYVMHIFLDPVKIAAYSLTVADVIQALKRQNIEKPAGKLVSKDREYLVTTVATMQSPEEFDQAVIATKEGHLIRLRDIGFAKVDSDDHRTSTRYNGKKGVSLSVYKQSTANPIDVAREVKKALPTIQEKLPPEINIQIGTDKTAAIEKSISEVYWTILEAIFLVVLVVFAFLKSARAAFIPLITIPISLIGTFFLMYLLNFSINIFTLMAMVLAIGLVVDDAIVVLENVYRHIEQGVKPFAAAFKALREISFAVVAMTVTLAAVYAPVALAKGMTGKLLTEFAITLSGAVIISGFAALTLSPMMCTRLLKSLHDEEPPKLEQVPYLRKFTVFGREFSLFSHYYNQTIKFLKEHYKQIHEKLSPYFDRYQPDVWLHTLEIRYQNVLERILQNQLKVAGIGVAFAFLGYLMFLTIPREFIPREDQGNISIDGFSPQTATLGYTDKYVNEIDHMLSLIDDIERRLTNVNNPTFDIFISLKPNHKHSTDEIVQMIKDSIFPITGVETSVRSSSMGVSGENERAVEFVIMGNKTYNELKSLGVQLWLSLKEKAPAIDKVKMQTNTEAENYSISIIRDKVSALNIEPALIADTVDALIRGKKATTFKRENKLYQVKVEVQDQDRQSPNDISNLFVKAGDKEGTLVPLSELVTVKSRAGPVEIDHYNRQRSISLTAFVKLGSGIAEAVDQVKSVAKDILLSDTRVEFTGETKRYLNETSTMLLVYGLALSFIYLVMAAQFESWRDPFIIILSVPLSLAGAVLTLALIKGGTINLYSNIGMVTLIGLITKHGIMMVDFANKLRDQGHSIGDAIIKACRLRLRPILMTTCAMVLGALPLALATGIGAESRKQIGWVIVGGMTIGTMFTLFIIPAFYTLLAKSHKKSLAVAQEL